MLSESVRSHQRVALPDLTRQSADAATLATLFTLCLMIIPARFVIRGISFSVTPANIIGLLMGVCWLCAQFTATLGAAKGRTPVRTALNFYTVATLVCYAAAGLDYLPNDERNFTDHTLVIALGFLGAAYAICDGARRIDRLDLVLKTIAVGGAVLGFIGLCQFMINLDLTTYLRIPGLRATSMGVAVISRDSQHRVASTTGHPIEFGVVCSMLLPLAIHYGAQARQKGLPYLRWWVCGALIASGEATSVSRSAVLTLLAVGFVLFLGWPSIRRLRAAIVVLVAIGVVGATTRGLLSTIYKLFANASNDSSVQVRTHRYAQAAQEISKHLWFGRGAGTWYFPKYNAFDNQYIMSMVETGLLGTASLVIIYVVGIYAAIRARRLSQDPKIRDLGLTLAAALCSPLVGAATFDMLTFAIVTGLSFLLIGSSGALMRISAAESQTRLAWSRGLFRRLWRRG